MANWNEFCETAKGVANKALRKTEELADVAAMRIRLKALENRRDEQYKLLGKLTYRQLKTGESQAEQIAPVLASLDRLREQIQKQKQEIEDERLAREAQKEQRYAEEDAALAAREAAEKAGEDEEL